MMTFVNLLLVSLALPQTGLSYYTQSQAELAHSCGQQDGTTDNIEEIFKGRCSEYIELINPGPFCNTNTDCNVLWSDFQAAFANRSACNITAGMYSDFINSSTHAIPRGKSMFWQGVNGFVHELTNKGKRFFALEDTLYGYILNKLKWCWSEEAGNFNFTKCPGRNACPRSPLSAYWEAASREFARVASGTVQVMINGSRTPPYNSSGFFGRVELPALNPTQVDKVVILLVHGLTLPVVETCNGKSITQLKEQVKDRGLAVDCIDDPSWVRFYMCVDNPTSSLCSSSASSQSSIRIFSSLLFVSCSYFL